MPVGNQPQAGCVADNTSRRYEDPDRSRPVHNQTTPPRETAKSIRQRAQSTITVRKLHGGRIIVRRRALPSRPRHPFMPIVDEDNTPSQPQIQEDTIESIPLKSHNPCWFLLEATGLLVSAVFKALAYLFFF
ncbi:hypothetical protein ACLX1H_011325 [Fusarium chlamydosporum]